jgi:hypothetical protein
VALSLVPVPDDPKREVPGLVDAEE